MFTASLPYGYAFGADGDPVQTIANPGNTSITVFDYWIYNNRWQSAPDANTTGINEDHVFLFSRSTSSQPNYWNRWTGTNGAATQGIVKPLLVDGYPVLNCLGGSYMDGICTGGSEESLAYLFDPNELNAVTPDGQTKPVKRVYSDVGELFTVDEEGHYIFNSDNENAILVRNQEEDSWEFKVTEQQKTENTGFFPLSDGKKPTNSKPDGWFFGVHISNDFSIPYDGMVLNPSGEYQEMVFEFTGDDDVWVFIDGILIGDVGGIHSKEYLSINFVTGEVIVKNPNHESGTTFTTTVYDMVVSAIGEEEARSQFEWKEEEDGTYKTFAGRTYHTLDFFYLERGGGNSNMEMRYNLISTYDFTAHKSLRLNKHDDVGKKLEENQFRYRLTGYPLTLTDDEETSFMEPVMPKIRPDRDVKWEPDYDVTKTLLEENEADEPFVKTLIVGNSLDGNINFGNTDLSSVELAQYVGKTFRYKLEELPPEDAVLNEDGTYTYKGETVYRNQDGTYTFDGITYHNAAFYYEGTISPEGWVNKKWYADEDFTIDASINFANFDNRYDSIGQAVLEGNKELFTASGTKVTDLVPNQFTFQLTDVTDPDNQTVIQPVFGIPAPGNDGRGHFSFDPIDYTLADNIPSGETSVTLTYKIEEIQDQTEAIIYSADIYYALVTLTDLGNGTLSVDVKYQDEACYEDDTCTQTIPSEQVIFTNRNRSSLTVDKTVTGSLGSKNRIFDFTLTMPEMAGQTVSCSTDGGAHFSDVSFDAEGRAEFSLRHLDRITFYNIEGTYTVEEAAAGGGYVTSWHSSADPDTEISSETAEGTISDDELTISYTNSLEGTPPTGIRDSLAPALAGIAAAALLLFTLWIGKERDQNA